MAVGEDTRGEKAVGTVKEVAVKARDEIRTMNFIFLGRVVFICVRSILGLRDGFVR